MATSILLCVSIILSWLRVNEKRRGQVFILDTCTVFSIFLIFLSIFLSFLNYSLTRLHAWDTPDSPIPHIFLGHVLNLADYF
jgi:hypothetical protein